MSSLRRLAAPLAAAAALSAATPALAGGQVISAAPALAAIPATLQVTVGGVGGDGLLDAQYSGYGRNISPPLGWSAGPPRTRAYAIAMEDPDAASPQPVVHWIAWNIPAAQRDLGRAVRNMAELERPAGLRQGRNSHGGVGYTGPHPPVGDPAHRYFVQVFALDRPLGLGPGADRDALARALAGHVIARGEAVVRYAQAPAHPAPRVIRLFVPDALCEGARVAPTPEQARYLLAVMRLGEGDALLLFNGRDGEWRARVTQAGKRGCTLGIEAPTRAQASPPDLDLLVALVKRARLEVVAEKAAELGARRVRLLLTRRTNADHTNVARLQAIATEAAEQTGRLDVPQVAAPERLDRVLDGWEPGRALMFCDEAGDDLGAEWGGPHGRAGPALERLRAAPPSPAWGVLIGPEGGFAPEERERLRAAPFATAVALGPRILRADTAAIAALTLWQAALGDWRAPQG